MNYYLKNITPLLVFLAIVLSLWILSLIFQLPNKDELLILARNFYETYGLLVVFVAAIIEGLFLVGWYLPGGTVMFLGVILAGSDIILVLINGLIISSGLIISYAINYLIGYYGWYKLLKKLGQTEHIKHYQIKIQKKLSTGIFFSYWHPNIAVWASTAAGILKINFKKFIFYSAFSLIIWNLLWGALVYTLGEKALAIISLKFILSILLALIIFSLLNSYYKLRGVKINNS